MSQRAPRDSIKNIRVTSLRQRQSSESLPFPNRAVHLVLPLKSQKIVRWVVTIMPTWRNGRRYGFKIRSPLGGMGSNPIVGNQRSAVVRVFSSMASSTLRS